MRCHVITYVGSGAGLRLDGECGAAVVIGPMWPQGLVFVRSLATRPITCKTCKA